MSAFPELDGHPLEYDTTPLETQHLDSCLRSTSVEVWGYPFRWRPRQQQLEKSLFINQKNKFHFHHVPVPTQPNPGLAINLAQNLVDVLVLKWLRRLGLRPQ